MLRYGAENVLEKLNYKLLLLKRIQDRDVRKQYIHENFTQIESNDYLKRLRETLKNRDKEIRELEKQIEEIKTS